MSGEIFVFVHVELSSASRMSENSVSSYSKRNESMGGVLLGEVEGDVFAVEFGEAGFGETCDQIGGVAFPADVSEDQMLRIRGEEFRQSRHCIGVAEVADPAHNAPFERKAAF